MRIAVFTDNDFRTASGLTTTLGAVLQYAPVDLRPRIYTSSTVPSAGPGAYAFREAGLRLARGWPDVRALLADAAEDAVRLVHVADDRAMGLSGRLVARRLSVPIVGSWRGDADGRRPVSRRVVDSYLRWFYSGCDAVLVPAAAPFDALVKRGVDHARLRLWPSGVDAERFHPARRQPDLRVRWGASEHRPAVLVASRLVAAKSAALECAIAVATLLRDHGVSHRLIVAGDGPLRETLARHCSDAVFLGEVPRAEMPDVMASSDALLFPSAGDSLGNVVLEAQASGVPAVTADRGGAGALVHHGQTGFTCAPGDHFDFAWRLTILLRDQARRRLLGFAARAQAETRPWRTSLAPLFDAWREALARASDRRHAALRYAHGWAGEP
jgi:glycosyltransferase involved in cell wall biosynthesis